MIRRSSIVYRRPVKGELRAICERPGEADFAVFKSRFERKGKARIPLRVRIEEEGEVCVEFEGDFVAIG